MNSIIEVDEECSVPRERASENEVIPLNEGLPNLEGPNITITIDNNSNTLLPEQTVYKRVLSHDQKNDSTRQTSHDTLRHSSSCSAPP